MKATGVVRRIDDLGRIVIPKEIRKTLRIKEGTPLEIFTEKEGDIILRKYSPVNELSHFSEDYVNCINLVTNYIAIVTDKDCVVAVSGIAKKDLLEQPISEDLEKVIEKRDAFNNINNDFTNKFIQITKKKNLEPCSEIIIPILSFSEIIGSIILLNTKSQFADKDMQIAKIAANFLGTQMEI